MSDVTAVPVTNVFPPAEPADDAPSESSFGQRVMSIARHLASLRGKTGERGQLAILRRMGAGPCDFPPEVFWAVVHRHGIPQAEEDVWLRLLPLMAVHRHDPSRSPGTALDEAGITPARLDRWLRADREDARTQAPRLLARLRDGGINWVLLAHLLRSWKPEQRRAIARDFFRSRHFRTSHKQGA